MSTCVPTPVSTVFSTVTGNTITTTYSLSTSAVPPVVTTNVNTYCQDQAVVLDSTVCLQTGTNTGIETLQPASDVVYTIPYETAIPVTTYVSANTVYGGCPNTPTNPGGGSGSGSSNGSNNSGSTANAGSSISVPPGLTLVTSSVLVYTTGPPTTSVIPSVVTLANGQVTTTSILTTITPTPSQVLVPTTALVEATGTSSPGPDSSGNVGMIVGAVIGGFIGLCLMILAWWYVRRRKKTAYDEILHEQEKQIDNQEARRQAIERSKDPSRKRGSDPKPAPYHYGSLLSSGCKIQSSTSTGVTLSQNPFDGAGIGSRAAYMTQGSPLFTTVPVMEEFGTSSTRSEVSSVAGAYGIEGSGEAKIPMNPSISSTSNTTGSIHTTGSAPTLEPDSSRSSDLDYLQPGSFADELTEADIAGPRVISPPPHLSMSFGSWNTNSSQGRESGGSGRSSGVDPGADPGPGITAAAQKHEEDEENRRLLRPVQQQRYTVGSHTTSTLVEATRVDVRSHLRKRSGSPVSLALPTRGTLFIVNQRNSEDL